MQARRMYDTSRPTVIVNLIRRIKAINSATEENATLLIDKMHGPEAALNLRRMLREVTTAVDITRSAGTKVAL